MRESRSYKRKADVISAFGKIMSAEDAHRPCNVITVENVTMRVYAMPDHQEMKMRKKPTTSTMKVPNPPKTRRTMTPQIRRKPTTTPRITSKPPMRKENLILYILKMVLPFCYKLHKQKHISKMHQKQAFQ
jgi:hypothetical protein